MKSETQYNLDDISGYNSLENMCKKQQKLIQLLQHQINMYRGVIQEMHNDILHFQSFVKDVALQFKMDYKLADNMQEGLDQFLDKLNIQTKKLSQKRGEQSQIKYITKQIPVFIDREIEVIKEIQKTIIVEKIIQLQQPIIVQKIIEVPCAICNKKRQKFIIT